MKIDSEGSRSIVLLELYLERCLIPLERFLERIAMCFSKTHQDFGIGRAVSGGRKYQNESNRCPFDRTQ
jgi:hypothetical protein